MIDNETKSWYGFDLDATLAAYDHWRGIAHVGDPIKPVVDRVKAMISDGKDVRIFTARAGPQLSNEERAEALTAISSWCQKHLGRVLPITATKDFRMVELWDDRAVQVVPNEGTRVDEVLARLRASVAAIHWHAAHSPADAATLLSIKEECEDALPILKTILTQ